MRLVDLILLYTENKSDATSNFTWCCPTGVLVAWVVIGFLQRFRNLCHPSRLTHHQCSGRMTKNIQHWVTSAETECCSMKSNFSVSFLEKDVHKDESQERWHRRPSLILDCLCDSWSPNEPTTDHWSQTILECLPFLKAPISSLDLDTRLVS